MNITLESPDQADVRALIAELDAYQDTLYPAEARYALDITSLAQPHVLFAVARASTGNAIGCGAIVLERASGELKRMFVSPEYRGAGVAEQVLRFLETQALASGCQEVLLETGPYQADALRFYTRHGYQRRAAFGSYPEHPLSVFMGKTLIASTQYCSP
jgi:putative acetyltransferase